MQKRKKIAIGVGAAVLFMILSCTAIGIHIWRQPSTQVALLLWDGMAKDGLVQNMLSMRQDPSYLAVCSSNLSMEMPLVGEKEVSLAGQIDETGLKFRLTDYPEVVCLYDFRDADKQGSIVKILGKENTKKIDGCLSMIAGDMHEEREEDAGAYDFNQSTDYDADRANHADNLFQWIFMSREVLSDLQITQAIPETFYVDGREEVLQGITVTLSKEDCNRLRKRYSEIAEADEQEAAGRESTALSELSRMISGETVRITLYHQEKHLAALQVSDNEQTLLALQETQDGFPKFLLHEQQLGDDMTISMEICYLPKELADAFPEATVDLGAFDFGQLMGGMILR